MPLHLCVIAGNSGQPDAGFRLLSGADFCFVFLWCFHKCHVNQLLPNVAHIFISNTSESVLDSEHNWGWGNSGLKSNHFLPSYETACASRSFGTKTWFLDRTIAIVKFPENCSIWIAKTYYPQESSILLLALIPCLLEAILSEISHANGQRTVLMCLFGLEKLQQPSWKQGSESDWQKIC